MSQLPISDGTYRLFVLAALATFLILVGAMVYQYVFVADEQGNLEYRRGNLRLEDGEFETALTEFDIVLRDHPEHAQSHLGRALALMALNRNEEAMEALGTALALKPDFAAVLANRGILHDRMGQYEEAVRDYRSALAIDPELASGPGWLTRFFRLQPERPPTIADRANFLTEELAKPPGERLLRLPEKDRAQRMYKVEGMLESSK